MTEISQELAQRMATCLRNVAAWAGNPPKSPHPIADAIAIVAELPVPVDPLLVEARALCLAVVADIEDAGGLKASWDYWYQTYHSGACDNRKDVQTIYARLRELSLVETGK